MISDLSREKRKKKDKCGWALTINSAAWKHTHLITITALYTFSAILLRDGRPQEVILHLISPISFVVAHYKRANPSYSNGDGRQSYSLSKTKSGKWQGGMCGRGGISWQVVSRWIRRSPYNRWADRWDWGWIHRHCVTPDHTRSQGRNPRGQAKLRKQGETPWLVCPGPCQDHKITVSSRIQTSKKLFHSKSFTCLTSKYQQHSSDTQWQNLKTTLYLIVSVSVKFHSSIFLVWK